MPAGGPLPGRAAKGTRTRTPLVKCRGVYDIPTRGGAAGRERQWIAVPPPWRADRTRVKHPIVNEDEPRMNSNRHEDRWTSLTATTSRDEAPRERGRLARTTLAQPRPSPPPGPTGNGARALFHPGPCGSRRQGGRAPHHGETERPPNAEDAGGTPALPEGRLSRVSSWITFFRLFQARCLIRCVTDLVGVAQKVQTGHWACGCLEL